jgi:hypothetical protein
VRLSGAILWLHVLCGVSWVGAAASFVLALVALAGQEYERRDFAVRVAPRLNRLCLSCAILLPLTGVANLAFAAEQHGGTLPPEFIGIVSVKLGLYALMAWMLWRAMERAAVISRVPPGASDQDDHAATLRGLVRLYGLMIAAGAVALLMGLWLAGVS